MTLMWRFRICQDANGVSDGKWHLGNHCAKSEMCTMDKNFGTATCVPAIEVNESAEMRESCTQGIHRCSDDELAVW